MQNPEGYRAAHEGAAVFDRSERGKVAVAGADRLSYLHAMLTNDIQPLQPGTGCYAAYLTPQGRMISDMRVLELGDLVLMDLPAPMAATVMQKLDQFVFTEDVKLGDLTQAFGELSVAGPASARVVAAALASGGASPQVTEEELASWTEFRNARTSSNGQMVLVVASLETGVGGFDLYIEAPHVPALREALLQAGAVPADAEVEEVLRVEAGRPRFGADMDAETIPLEAGIDERAISFTKGCYPGQEVIIRVVHRGGGRVARRLVGLVVEGDGVPAAGATIRVTAATGEAKEIGRVTSAVWSPRLAKTLALGYVHRDHVKPGTKVTLDAAHGVADATVSELPFA